MSVFGEETRSPFWPKPCYFAVTLPRYPEIGPIS